MVHLLAQRLVEWLKEQAAARGARGYVVGLSGGIDSAVTAVLCKQACPDDVLGVIMPCYSNPQDAEDARLVAETFAIPFKEIVLDEPFTIMVRLLTGDEKHVQDRELSIANIKPRLRMITLYFYASRLKYLVAGTGNRSELTVGYFTKHGDGGVDLLPLGNLVKRQVYELAEHLGIPRRIIEKPPSAGLWSGQNDEAEMGISYRELDEFILTGKADQRVMEVVKTLATKNAHKKQLPAIPPF
ncbi:NAD(+) synthase [Desulfofundulus australicus]|uniref:NAD(+) synthase n=1 Tax=Desulfofundulus australicus TaxID=1566 RepID=UPI000933BCFE|nr:NAD(+) synthase [Desulfofundulus australicus]